MIKTTYVCDRCGLEYNTKLYSIYVPNPDSGAQNNFDVCQNCMGGFLATFKDPVAVTLAQTVIVPKPVNTVV